MFFVTRVLHGQFPNYAKVIPASFANTVKIDRVALLSALRRVLIVAKKNSEKATFAFGVDGLQVRAASSDFGTACEEIACECDSKTIIGLNVRYMIEFLASMNCGIVTLQLNGSLNPLKITGDGGDWLGIQMPMQV